MEFYAHFVLMYKKGQFWSSALTYTSGSEVQGWEPGKDEEWEVGSCLM